MNCRTASLLFWVYSTYVTSTGMNSYCLKIEVRSYISKPNPIRLHIKVGSQVEFAYRFSGSVSFKISK